MATPFPFASGDVLTAANLNGTADVPRVLVRNSANQSLTVSSYTALTFDDEIYDTHGMHSTTTNTNRLTVPAGWGGYYHVWASALTTVANQFGSLFKNGSVLVYGLGGTYTDRVGVFAVVSLNVGDYLDFRIYSGGGGSAWGHTSLGGYTPQFGAIWVAPS